MDAPKEEKIFTIEDIYALPDGERAELIGGKIYYMAPPRHNASKIYTFTRKGAMVRPTGSLRLFRKAINQKTI